MKTLKYIITLLLLQIIFSLNGFGQIKIDNGSYTSKVNDLKEEVRIVPTIPSYSMLFVERLADSLEKETGKKREIQWCEIEAYLNLKQNDLNGGGFHGYRVNPVGESIYIPNNFPKRLFLNIKDMTATVKSIPQGYYTIIGWFGRYEESQELREKAVVAHRSMLENYSFDNEDNRIFAICMFADAFDYGGNEGSETWVNNFKKLNDYNKYVGHDKDGVFGDGLRYTGGSPAHEYRGKFSIYVLEDQDGNLYYDFHELFMGYADEKLQNGYVSVTCYNKITELLLNKDVVIRNGVPSKDYLTGEKLERDKIGNEFFCKDIFLWDDNLIGVFRNEHGEITMKLDGYRCFRFDMLGYKGHVMSGNTSIYPKEYEELRDNAYKLECQQQEAESQRQKREWEQAREKRRQELVAKYGDKYGNLISKGKVAIGMTKEMCREAVGYPSNQYSATTARGTSEIWVYYVFDTTTVLYFDENVLYLIENEK